MTPPTPTVHAIDHLVLTVRDVEAACAFYARVLGVEVLTFGAGRKALAVGVQKINLQPLGQETRNHAVIGGGDLCLLTDRPVADWQAHLAAQGVTVIEGPVVKAGAQGPITSLYFTDPDGHLIEIARYDSPDASGAGRTS